MFVALPLLLYLAAFHPTVSADLLSEYAHHAVLDAEEKMKLFWTIDWDTESVSFAVEAETTGWVGFGFSTRSGQMVGSDVVIGWVKDNKGYLADRYADAKAIPPIDEQQDYELTGYQESGGKTLLKFKRKFDTCDPRDRKLEGGATKVVFAYHSEDPVSSTDMKPHEFRGAKSILLLNSMDKRNINETGWNTFSLTTKNVTIPGNKTTTYWCTLLKGPELKSKHHITKIVPSIQKGNEGFVHHLLLFECHGNFTKEQFDQGGVCYSHANMPRCRDYILAAAWAVGGLGIYFPPHVGYPIGATDSPKSYMLEIHYDNPDLIEGTKDSSGVTFYYTDKLRKYDVGIADVGIGINSWHIIPPKQKDWVSVGYCMHQCTESLFESSGLPGGGIKVFGSGLHTHLAGRASWTKHIRNGKELPEIARDNHYDFNFQDFHVLRKEITILPGDDLIHYCKYDSMDRDRLIRGGQSTKEYTVLHQIEETLSGESIIMYMKKSLDSDWGGFSTKDEMCLNFLFYYPRIKDFTSCRNTVYEPSLELIDKYFPNVNMSESRSNNPLVKMDIKWTGEMANDLRKYQSEVDTLIPGHLCYRENINDPKFRVPIPEITDPLPPKTYCPVLSGAVMPASCALLVGVLCAVIDAVVRLK